MTFKEKCISDIDVIIKELQQLKGKVILDEPIEGKDFLLSTQKLDTLIIYKHCFDLKDEEFIFPLTIENSTFISPDVLSRFIRETL